MQRKPAPDKVVTIKIVTSHSETEIEESMARAFAAFYHIESVCSRFNNQSELSRLSAQIVILFGLTTGKILVLMRL
ncbi:MAG TPA: hypothetical protein DD730_13295 [Desulfosporosinus sp.]|nr:hypothetical protein [Desulfosporosinus sp.]